MNSADLLVEAYRPIVEAWWRGIGRVFTER